jgi:hypothetical protein
MVHPGRVAVDGPDIVRILLGTSDYASVGLALTWLIERNLGEERLRASGRDAELFFSAYQEAALLNPAESEAEPGSLDHKLDQLAPFAAATYTPLRELLRAEAARFAAPATETGTSDQPSG